MESRGSEVVIAWTRQAIGGDASQQQVLFKICTPHLGPAMCLVFLDLPALRECI